VNYQVDALKRQNTILKLEVERLTIENDALRNPKKPCKDCIGGCPQSEITGYSCNPKD
jgi:hypothetical protein